MKTTKDKRDRLMVAFIEASEGYSPKEITPETALLYDLLRRSTGYMRDLIDDVDEATRLLTACGLRGEATER